MTQPTYTTSKLTIAPGGSETVSRAATFLICLSATHRFRIRFEHGHETDFEAGLKFRQTADFTRLEVINPSTTDPLTVELGFGRGDMDDARLVLSGTIATTTTITGTPSVQVQSGEVNIKERSPDEVWTGPAIVIPTGMTDRIALKDSRRKRIHIWCGDVNGGNFVFISDTGNPPIHTGYPITSRERLVLETSHDLYIRNDSGANVSIYTLEERWENSF